MIKRLFRKLAGSKDDFSSRDYWENRYKSSGNSGAGSYGHLATFKAEVLNSLFRENHLTSIIEFGCGDGNQLNLLTCQRYTGLDVSVSALGRCISLYGKDKTKSFFLYDYRCFIDREGTFKKDCALSLDVLFHLVEYEVYLTYLEHLFASASKMVIIYAADIDIGRVTPHEMYRQFTKDIENHLKGWKLTKTIRNKYPSKNIEDQEGSLADFFVYEPTI